MASQYVRIPPDGGGASAGVNTFNGRFGNVVPEPGDYPASSIVYDNGASGLTATDVQAAIDEVSARENSTPNALAAYDNDGKLATLPGAFYDPSNANGIRISQNGVPTDANTDYRNVNSTTVTFNPSAPSQQHWQMRYDEVDVGTDDSGFKLGDNSNGGVDGDVTSVRVEHLSSVGSVSVKAAYFSLGNGTDPLTAGSVNLLSGNAYINDNSTVRNLRLIEIGFGSNAPTTSVTENVGGVSLYGNLGDIGQGVSGFSTGVNYKTIGYSNVFATFDHYDVVTGGANVFSDFTQILTSTNGLTSFLSQPQIALTNSYTGLSVSPNVTMVMQNAHGIDVNMSNVTGYAGAKSSLVVQDITYQATNTGDYNDNITIAYVSDVTAGSEYATLAGLDITVHIQSGVSTATQVRAAIQAQTSISSNVSATITGTASNAQTTYAAHHLAGGQNAAQVLAANFQGDVRIQGALSFSGDLSLGRLESYAAFAIADNGGAVASGNSLISAPTVAAGVTVANGDTLGINTAALITLGANSHVTTSFLGVAALGLPAVLSMGTGSTIDLVSGATFALSLDASASGGAVDVVALCRALALPNGVTTVNRLYGYEMELPFGDPGTTSWGVYIKPAIHNYMAGDLLVGGTPASADTVTNASVGIELNSTTKAILNSRMTTTQRNALTAVNGMQVYNTTTDKLQVYAAGVWVDLH